MLLSFIFHSLVLFFQACQIYNIYMKHWFPICQNVDRGRRHNSMNVKKKRQSKKKRWHGTPTPAQVEHCDAQSSFSFGKLFIAKINFVLIPCAVALQIACSQAPKLHTLTPYKQTNEQMHDEMTKLTDWLALFQVSAFSTSAMFFFGSCSLAFPYPRLRLLAHQK